MKTISPTSSVFEDVARDHSRQLHAALQAATGDKPLHYLQRLRIGPPEGMLSSTRKHQDRSATSLATATPAFATYACFRMARRLSTITVASSLAEGKLNPDIAGPAQASISAGAFPTRTWDGWQVGLGFSDHRRGHAADCRAFQTTTRTDGRVL